MLFHIQTYSITLSLFKERKKIIFLETTCWIHKDKTKFPAWG